MAEPFKKKKPWWKRWRTPYQMVVMTDDTFEIKSSARISVWGFVLVLLSGVVLVALLVFFLIFFTPLKRTLPGYGDVNMKKDLIELSMEFDSISALIGPITYKIDHLNSILEEEGDLTLPGYKPGQNLVLPPDSGDTIIGSIPPSVVEPTKNKYSERIMSSFSSLRGLLLFPPVTGASISDTFNADIGHYGLDLVCKDENAPVMAVMDGTVVNSGWDYNTGHIVVIQHDNNLMSVYKHNSVLLKKVGNFVKEGDVVALAGNSGKLSTGPHLHFELWYNGFPVDPLDYLNLKE